MIFLPHNWYNYSCSLRIITIFYINLATYYQYCPFVSVKFHRGLQFVSMVIVSLYQSSENKKAFVLNTNPFFTGHPRFRISIIIKTKTIRKMTAYFYFCTEKSSREDFNHVTWSPSFYDTNGLDTNWQHPVFPVNFQDFDNNF